MTQNSEQSRGKADEIEIVPVKSDFFSSRFFAPRPANEMLLNQNLENLGIDLMRPWPIALREYISSEYMEYIGLHNAGELKVN